VLNGEKLKPGDGLLTIKTCLEDEPPHIIVAISLITAISWEGDEQTKVIHARRVFTHWVGAN
jgi:hypothetical protein